MRSRWRGFCITRGFWRTADPENSLLQKRRECAEKNRIANESRIPMQRANLRRADLWGGVGRAIVAEEANRRPGARALLAFGFGQKREKAHPGRQAFQARGRLQHRANVDRGPAIGREKVRTFL